MKYRTNSGIDKLWLSKRAAIRKKSKKTRAAPADENKWVASARFIEESCVSNGGRPNDTKDNSIPDSNCEPAVYLKNLTLVGNHSTKGSFFNNSKLQGANLENSYFGNGNIQNADFSYTNLVRSHFSNISLDRVIFDNSNLAHATFEKLSLQFDRGTSFRNCDCVSITFKQSYLTNLSFRRASLDFAKFTDVDIEALDFETASLVHADFSSATFFSSDESQDSTNFKDANLSAVDFRGANFLTPAIFEGAYAVDTRPPMGLDDKNLRQIELCSAKLIPPRKSRSEFEKIGRCQWRRLE